MVTDPVCYTEIDPANAAFTNEFRGQTYYFHSRRCRDVFRSNPDEYASHIPEKVYGDHRRIPDVGEGTLTTKTRKGEDTKSNFGVRQT